MSNRNNHNHRNKRRATRYTHLVALIEPKPTLQTKEYLDIALVSASYDITTAVFLSDTVVLALRDAPSIDIEQAFAMLEEFAVTLFAESEQTLYGQQLQAIRLIDLQSDCRHVFCFGENETV